MMLKLKRANESKKAPYLTKVQITPRVHITFLY